MVEVMNAADMKCLLEIYEGVNLLNAKIDSLICSNERLTSGPGGIMEMKQTIADKEAEIVRLREALDDIASGRYSGIMLLTYPPKDPAVERAREALGEEK